MIPTPTTPQQAVTVLVRVTMIGDHDGQSRNTATLLQMTARATATGASRTNNAALHQEGPENETFSIVTFIVKSILSCFHHAMSEPCFCIPSILFITYFVNVRTRLFGVLFTEHQTMEYSSSAATTYIQ